MKKILLMLSVAFLASCAVDTNVVTDANSTSVDSTSVEEVVDSVVTDSIVVDTLVK